MGVDHGGKRGTSPPRIWSRGTLMQIVPLRFLSYRYKKEQSVAFKIRHNPFSARALPRTPLGSSWCSPDPLVGWRGDPSPHHTRFGTDPPLVLAMRPPQNSSQISFQKPLNSEIRQMQFVLRFIISLIFSQPFSKTIYLNACSVAKYIFSCLLTCILIATITSDNYLLYYSRVCI